MELFLEYNIDLAYKTQLMLVLKFSVSDTKWYAFSVTNTLKFELWFFSG